MNQVSEGGAEFSMLSGVLVQNRLFKKGMVAIPFFNFLFWWLVVDVATRL